MENILIKALKEVLTPKYSEELRDSYDAGYVTTAEFDGKMRELIRKTDRPPIFRYTRYIAAAAGIMLAIGAAVLVPILMNNNIGTVDKPEPENTSDTSLPAITLNIDTTEDDSSFTTSVDTVEAITVPSSDKDNTTVQSPENTTSETTANSPTVDTETSESDTTAPTVTTDDKDSGNVVDISEGDDAYDYDGDDDAAAVVDDSEDDVIDSYDDESIIGGDDDDDIAYTDDSEHITAADGTTLDGFFAEKVGGMKFEDLYAVNGSYYRTEYDASYLNPPFMDFSVTDYDFIQDFVHKLGTAKADSDVPDTGDERTMVIRISDRKPIVSGNVRTVNSSYWLNYKDYFDINSIDEDDDYDYIVEDDDDDSDYDTIWLSVRIHAGSGRVEFLDSLRYYDKEKNKIIKYSIDTSFYMDTAEVKKLMDAADKLCIPDDVTTVKDISDALGVTKENIGLVYSNITSIYDTSAYGMKIDSGYVADLFTKYAGRSIKRDTEYRSSSPMEIRVVLKNHAILFVNMTRDGYMTISDSRKRYILKYDSGEIERAIDAVSSASGVIIPKYSTLGEYLADKNFKSLSLASYTTGAAGNEVIKHTVTDKGELKKIYDLLKKAADSAKYTYDGSHSLGADNVFIKVTGYLWKIDLYVNENILCLGNNLFIMPEGICSEIKQLILESKTAEKTSWIVNNIDDDDEECSDDVDYDDSNPIT